MYTVPFRTNTSNLKAINEHIAALITKHLRQEITAEETRELENWIVAAVQNMIQLEQLKKDETLPEELIANDKSDRRIEAQVYARLKMQM